MGEQASEHELPLAHVLAGVQAAWLLELSLISSINQELRNSPPGIILLSPPGLRLAESRPARPGTLCAPLQSSQTYITCPSFLWVGGTGTQGGEWCPHSHGEKPRAGAVLPRGLWFHLTNAWQGLGFLCVFLTLTGNALLLLTWKYSPGICHYWALFSMAITYTMSGLKGSRSTTHPPLVFPPPSPCCVHRALLVSQQCLASIWVLTLTPSAKLCDFLNASWTAQPAQHSSAPNSTNLGKNLRPIPNLSFPSCLSIFPTLSP